MMTEEKRQDNHQLRIDKPINDKGSEIVKEAEQELKKPEGLLPPQGPIAGISKPLQIVPITTYTSLQGTTLRMYAEAELPRVPKPKELEEAIQFHMYRLGLHLVVITREGD